MTAFAWFALSMFLLAVVFFGLFIVGAGKGVRAVGSAVFNDPED